MKISNNTGVLLDLNVENVNFTLNIKYSIVKKQGGVF